MNRPREEREVSGTAEWIRLGGSDCVRKMVSMFFLIQAFGRYHLSEADDFSEYRMSNKEFRMIKFNSYD